MVSTNDARAKCDLLSVICFMKVEEHITANVISFAHSAMSKGYDFDYGMGYSSKYEGKMIFKFAGCYPQRYYQQRFVYC